jgi:hypothetical protein
MGARRRDIRENGENANILNVIIGETKASRVFHKEELEN